MSDIIEHDFEKTLKFARLMHEQLNANLNKGNFFDWNPDFDLLISELQHHYNKMIRAIESRDKAGVLEFSADMANYMHKFAEIYGGLHDDGTDGGKPVVWSSRQIRIAPETPISEQAAISNDK